MLIKYEIVECRTHHNSVGYNKHLGIYGDSIRDIIYKLYEWIRSNPISEGFEDAPNCMPYNINYEIYEKNNIDIGFSDPVYIMEHDKLKRHIKTELRKEKINNLLN